jgi:subtilisin family serine protease
MIHFLCLLLVLMCSRVEAGTTLLVAVIDTGLDAEHPALAGAVKRESDDSYGYDFVSNAPSPRDDIGHGTHIAGIIHEGAPGVLLLPLKYYEKGISGNKSTINVAKAIRYAVDHGAKIINLSGGGPEFNGEEFYAVKYAMLKGVLMVVAAGNEGQNIDNVDNRYYPASYRLPNVIAVGNIDNKGKMHPDSNWGVKTVDLYAEGENVYSTIPGGKYGYLTGTSQATAKVTAVAAALLTIRPDLSPFKVKQYLCDSVDTDIDAVAADKVACHGKVSKYNALRLYAL